jgi:Ras-related protein Rab-1A
MISHFENWLLNDFSLPTVFDDGDINCLRRSALCLKSGRHFAAGETLDQLPLTHPEHFGTPVTPTSSKRGRRGEQDVDESDDERSSKKSDKQSTPSSLDPNEMPKIGEVVCIVLGDKKRQKDNWVPGLVVAPTAQDQVKIKIATECLIRSFQDGRYYTVPRKEIQPFNKTVGERADTNTLRTAVEKALYYLDKDQLPPHWDRDVLFGRDMLSDRDSSDDDVSIDIWPKHLISEMLMLIPHFCL